ncbi:hypothetical protein K491DRAFT_502249 [Lophiostoma macrostomum CBS 122681]|uniref:Uncharacterized protein n=1 Tax=Lophiostoma macrostomum CBS 122681 TaxID=1314788 RepID=A0A6A6T1A4_9PLEO|nr:hypothetical protein K491DRAFT_502249 [Lophiostoma macrostomum CBS 122681]
MHLLVSHFLSRSRHVCKIKDIPNMFVARWLILAFTAVAASASTPTNRTAPYLYWCENPEMAGCVTDFNSPDLLFGYTTVDASGLEELGKCRPINAGPGQSYTFQSVIFAWEHEWDDVPTYLTPVTCMFFPDTTTCVSPNNFSAFTNVSDLNFPELGVLQSGAVSYNCTWL